MFSWWGTSEKEQNEDKVAENTDENTNQGGSENEVTGDRKVEQKDATETAKDLAKNFGSFLYSVANVATKTAVKVKDTVKESAEGKGILADFNKEQEKFVSEKHNKRKETGVPPWVGYHEEETMKSQILALSSDERNFLRDPPSGVQFHYEYESMFPVALATLEEDPELKKMRFNLVPKKVKESAFWRNYFYRVSLIKQSSQLTSLASGADKTSNSAENLNTSEQSSTQSSDNSDLKKQQEKGHRSRTENISEDLGEMTLSSSPPQDEFISDAFEGAHELSKEDLEQIGVDRLSDKSESKKTSTTLKLEANSNSETKPKTNETTESNIPDWERELQEELQEYDVVVNEEDDDNDDGSWEKEIEDMLEAEET
ncbi:synapse-associated protein 1-like [Dendronephthya gigantea]|uniref:synapse-associated protein 1-like n=1 Tax=Dendronephthya gigantea TaxID=151771 RepID=UPI00106CE463|nr:synapse-associated protein 1-like [Dendronephthya gigantea]